MGNRRDFLKATTLATTGLFISSLDEWAAANKPSFTKNDKFELKILATDWGFVGGLEAFCKKVKEEGYDGIEAWWPREKSSQEQLFALLKKYQLDIGFLCGGSQSNWEQHLNSFKQATNEATQAAFRPLYINCHSGRDYFTYEENKAFIDHTTQLTKNTGIPIYHETHRSRMLFAAPIAKKYIENNPDLRLTLDISHWCNVSESLLQDQQATVDLALSRVGHIHSRIGHSQGPQVNDPRAPEWEGAVKAHFAWWDKVVERKKKNGERLTVLTEFGPPDYMPTLPYTRQPLADQWAVNVHMMKLFRERYA
jgi:sugar phosphate isomerase/epimerase